MGYHSYLYFDAKGFTSHLNVVSGDDDLFVNEVSNARNTGVQIDPDSFVYSIPKKTFSKWEFQKRRHLTTAPKYKWSHKLMLIVLPVSQYLFYGFLITLLLLNFEVEFILTLLGIKVFLYGIIQFFNMKRLQVLDLFLWSVFLEPVLMLFYPWVSFLNIVKEDQRKRWI